MPEGPLSDIRVLEFSIIVALPFNGVLLSDLGADVVKVEAPAGDPYRNAGAVVPHESKRFQSLNRGKRSLTVDLSTEQGRELIYRILPRFDVATVNYRPGVAKRLGIDYATLSAIHPALVYAELSGYGSRGPMAGEAATDVVASAYSGLIVGDEKLGPGGEPLGMAPAISDYMSGLALAMAIVAALRHRDRTGEGQHIEGALLRSALAIQDVSVLREPVTDATLRDPMLEDVRAMRARGVPYSEQVARRTEYRAAGAGPPRLYYRAYVARDGAIALGCITKPTRDGARRVLAMHHDRSDDPDFDARDPASRAETARWMAEVEARIREQPVSYWLERFRKAGVPCAPVQFPEELSDDPQVAAMEYMVDLEHEVTGPQRAVGPIVSMSKTPPRARGAAPPLGRHTSEVLREAGLNDDEIARLRDTGVISGE